MKTLAAILALFGAVIFLVAWVQSIYFGFRKKFWWGMGLLLLPVIMHVPFSLMDKSNRRIWGRTMLLGIVLCVLSSAIVDEFSSSIVTVIIIGLGWYWLTTSNNSSNTQNKSNALSNAYHNKNSILNNIKIIGVGDHEQSLRNQVEQQFSTKAFKKSLLDNDLMHDIRQYNSKHFVSILQESKGHSLDIRDERISLFIELMKSKYRLGPVQTLSLLFHVHNEVEYEHYASSFDDIPFSSMPEFIKEIVLYDIHNDIERPRYDFIQRLLISKGAKKWNLRNPAVQYEKAKKAIKLQHFEGSLNNQGNDSFANIEQAIRSEHQRAKIDSVIRFDLDTNLENYIVTGADYSRDSRIDRHYRNHFAYTLSKAFDGHCCKCGEGMGQLEFDHFWLPKSSGGNFLMRSSEGLYINNCIPLCRSCNSSKGNRNYQDFFSEKELIEIVKRSQTINAYINEHMIDFDDPEFISRTY